MIPVILYTTNIGVSTEIAAFLVEAGILEETLFKVPKDLDELRGLIRHGAEDQLLIIGILDNCEEWANQVVVEAKQKNGKLQTYLMTVATTIGKHWFDGIIANPPASRRQAVLNIVQPFLADLLRRWV